MVKEILATLHRLHSIPGESSNGNVSSSSKESEESQESSGPISTEIVHNLTTSSSRFIDTSIIEVHPEDSQLLAFASQSFLDFVDLHPEVQSKAK